ncbi:hypothetical protein PFISCL1PPCAC_2905, partial [Pristionchus fissidentatus]
LTLSAKWETNDFLEIVMSQLFEYFLSWLQAEKFEVDSAEWQEPDRKRFLKLGEAYHKVLNQIVEYFLSRLRTEQFELDTFEWHKALGESFLTLGE